MITAVMGDRKYLLRSHHMNAFTSLGWIDDQCLRRPEDVEVTLPAKCNGLYIESHSGVFILVTAQCTCCCCYCCCYCSWLLLLLLLLLFLRSHRIREHFNFSFSMIVQKGNRIWWSSKPELRSDQSLWRVGLLRFRGKWMWLCLQSVKIHARD